MFFLCFNSPGTSSFHLGCSKLGRVSLLNAQTAEVTEPPWAGEPETEKDRKDRPAAQRPGQNSLCTTQVQGAESASGASRARGGAAESTSTLAVRQEAPK